MKRLILIMLVGLFVGCDQLEFKNNKESIATNGSDGIPANAIRIKSDSFADEIKVKVAGTDPKKYTIQFSWPYLENNKIIRIRLGNVLTEVLPNQTYFTHVLAHNQTVTFSFDILDQNRKPERTINKTVIIPTDFVVDKENGILTADIKIDVNRFYLNEEIPLTVGTHTLSVVANEFHSERGIIQTFPDKVIVHNKKTNEDSVTSPTAVDFNKGRDGGNIFISSSKLYGRLKVFMRGENGGLGKPGPAKDGQREGYGSPAGQGVIKCDMNPCDAHPNACFLNNKGQSPLLTFSSGKDCYCHSYGNSGGQGIEGEKGHQGGQGMSGGHSGNTRLSFFEYVPSEGIDEKLPQEDYRVVQIFQLPGKGGFGGEGGEGQRGSLGGVGRNPHNPLDCRGEMGPEGKFGLKGDQGPSGKDGEKGLQCVYVGSENINECSQ